MPPQPVSPHVMPARLATSLGEIIVRPAVTGDAAQLRRLRIEALAQHPQAFAADHDAAVVEAVEAWTRRINDYAESGKGVICIAEAAGELVGMAGLSRGNWPKTRHSAVIWGVYVRAGWRGCRAADALVKACLAWAQQHDVVTVKLGVITTNAPAIRCYARCGFTVYGVDPQAICYDGVYYDELLMVKLL